MRSRTVRLTLMVTFCVLAYFQPALSATLSLTWENIFLEDFGAQGVVVSPDGKWVAVTANTHQGRGIYLVSTSDGEPELWVDFTPRGADTRTSGWWRRKGASRRNS